MCKCLLNLLHNNVAGRNITNCKVSTDVRWMDDPMLWCNEWKQSSGDLKYMCWVIFLIASSGYSHLPSSFRQTSLLSTALTMTSRVSPALTGSSFPLHFLLVSVGLMVTLYNTCISPSYWEEWKMTSCEYEKILIWHSWLHKIMFEWIWNKR